MTTEQLHDRTTRSAVTGTTSEKAATDTGDGFGRIKRNRTEGFVIECDGERAVIAAHGGATNTASEDYWAVGQLISVQVGESRVVGLIYGVDARDGTWDHTGDNTVHIRIELVGEIRPGDDGRDFFSTGIVNYPHMGAVAHRIRARDLAAVYAAGSGAVTIGNLSQDASIPALITVDSLLSRHFAVVGTTGVGKSTAVTLLLRKIVEERPDIRVMLLDPHNEFTSAFPDHAITVDSNTLQLPFWMFQLDEFVEVIFRGRPIVPEEVDVLRDLIPLAKETYASEAPAQTTLRKREREGAAITADTPLPYRMMDLIKLIQDREGQLDGKADRPVLRSLRNRLEAIMQDTRFRFMFHSKIPGDSLEPILSHLFRVPIEDRPICVLEMSGLPSEVVNSVVSVLARFAFEIAVSSNGTIATLLVCEEAHRYIPADKNAGFWPTRTAIARIAKEGRKYGVFLAVITQRPGELDPTILSQCSTIFAMRLGNESDKEIIRQAISGAARSTTSFLSSIANREAIAFGEAVPTPMRMMFETVEKSALPGSHIHSAQQHVREGNGGTSFHDIVRRMRKQEQIHAHYDPGMENTPSIAFVGESVDDQRPSVQAEDAAANGMGHAIAHSDQAASDHSHRAEPSNGSIDKSDRAERLAAAIAKHIPDEPRQGAPSPDERAHAKAQRAERLAAAVAKHIPDEPQKTGRSAAAPDDRAPGKPQKVDSLAAAIAEHSTDAPPRATPAAPAERVPDKPREAGSSAAEAAAGRSPDAPQKAAPPPAAATEHAPTEPQRVDSLAAAIARHSPGAPQKVAPAPAASADRAPTNDTKTSRPEVRAPGAESKKTTATAARPSPAGASDLVRNFRSGRN